MKYAKKYHFLHIKSQILKSTLRNCRKADFQIMLCVYKKTRYQISFCQHLLPAYCHWSAGACLYNHQRWKLFMLTDIIKVQGSHEEWLQKLCIYFCRSNMAKTKADRIVIMRYQCNTVGKCWESTTGIKMKFRKPCSIMNIFIQLQMSC